MSSCPVHETRGRAKRSTAAVMEKDFLDQRTDGIEKYDNLKQSNRVDPAKAL